MASNRTLVIRLLQLVRTDQATIFRNLGYKFEPKNARKHDEKRGDILAKIKADDRIEDLRNEIAKTYRAKGLVDIANDILASAPVTRNVALTLVKPPTGKKKSCTQAWPGGLKHGILIECDRLVNEFAPGHPGKHGNKAEHMEWWGGRLSPVEEVMAQKLREGQNV